MIYKFKVTMKDGEVWWSVEEESDEPIGVHAENLSNILASAKAMYWEVEDGYVTVPTDEIKKINVYQVDNDDDDDDDDDDEHQEPEDIAYNPWRIKDFSRFSHFTQQQITDLVRDKKEILVPSNVPYNGEQPNESQFRFKGAPAFYAQIDPLVSPGQKSHHIHMFVGNTMVNSTSTGLSLLSQGGSTVQGGVGNRSAYWLPAMLDANRNIVVPASIDFYYKTRLEGSDIEIIPTGLGLLAGNYPRYSAFRAEHRLHWGFYIPTRGMVVDRINTIPRSNPNGEARFRAVVQFPDIIDTSGDDNHKYSEDTRNMVPNGYYGIYQLTMLVDWFWEEDTPSWYLSSDDLSIGGAPGHSLHADVMFAWNQELQTIWHSGCWRKNCSGGQLGGSHRLSDFNSDADDFWTNQNQFRKNVRIPIDG